MYCMQRIILNIKTITFQSKVLWEKHKLYTFYLQIDIFFGKATFLPEHISWDSSTLCFCDAKMISFKHSLFIKMPGTSIISRTTKSPHLLISKLGRDKTKNTSIIKYYCSPKITFTFYSFIHPFTSLKWKNRCTFHPHNIHKFT